MKCKISLCVYVQNGEIELQSSSTNMCVCADTVILQLSCDAVRKCPSVSRIARQCADHSTALLLSLSIAPSFRWPQRMERNTNGRSL